MGFFCFLSIRVEGVYARAMYDAVLCFSCGFISFRSPQSKWGKTTTTNRYEFKESFGCRKKRLQYLETITTHQDQLACNKQDRTHRSLWAVACRLAAVAGSGVNEHDEEDDDAIAHNAMPSVCPSALLWLYSGYKCIGRYLCSLGALRVLCLQTLYTPIIPAVLSL